MSKTNSLRKAWAGKRTSLSGILCGWSTILDLLGRSALRQAPSVREAIEADVWAVGDDFRAVLYGSRRAPHDQA